MRSPRIREPPKPIKVFLLCSGLGRVRRGYEAFVRDCFEVLRGEPEVDVHLFKGAGPDADRDRSVWNLHRNGFGARVAGELVGRGTYVVEQATFAAGLIPHLVREAPDVVYYCDPTIGKLLWHWRRLTGAHFRLLMHNGGPHPPPFRWCDHVHQLTPWAASAALEAGQEQSRQTVIPCGVAVGPEPGPAAPAERGALRSSLDLPPARAVVLSVGALNRGHKRMDYLIGEVASMPSPRPFLVMLGEAETETPMVRATAELLLGRDGFALRTVSREDIGRYYQAADVFALASLNEAFGLGYVEAMAHGLPCLAHDSPVTRYVLDGYGRLGDLERPGALAAMLRSVLRAPDPIEVRLARHRAVADRFGWPVLAGRYVAMIEACAETAPAVRAIDRPVPVEVEAPVS